MLEEVSCVGYILYRFPDDAREQSHLISQIIVKLPKTLYVIGSLSEALVDLRKGLSFILPADIEDFIEEFGNLVLQAFLFFFSLLLEPIEPLLRLIMFLYSGCILCGVEDFLPHFSLVRREQLERSMAQVLLLEALPADHFLALEADPRVHLVVVSALPLWLVVEYIQRQ